MIDMIANCDKITVIGRLGENEHRRVKFPIADYLEMYPGAVISLLNRLPGTDTAYPVATTTTDSEYLYWTVTSADLSREGQGQCELVVMLGDVVAKSVIYITRVLIALDGSGEAPEPWDEWQTEFARMKAETEAAAVAATEARADAQTEAAAASESADNARDAAQAADDASGAAIAAQGAAQGYAAEALRHAGTASDQAALAAGSAGEAARSAGDAGTSRAAAVAAQEAAEEAQGNAETAQIGAEDARDTAEEYRDEVVGAAEGIAQQTTAQRIAEEVEKISGGVEELIEVNRSVRWYDELPDEGVEGYTYITPDGVFHYHAGEFTQVSGGGGLNGFGLALDAENRVVLSYTNPEDETDTAEAVMPSDSTGAEIVAELQTINATLYDMIPGGEQEG